MAQRASADEISYIRSHYNTDTVASMARALGRTSGFVRYNMANLGLYPDTSSKYKTSALPGEVKYIRKNYLKVNVAAMARHLGRSPSFVKTQLAHLQLVIPEKVRQARAEIGQIKTGQVSHTKGRSWDEWMPAESQKKCRSVFFRRKAGVPHSTYDGHDIARYQSPKGAAWFIKVPGKWVQLNRYIWEQHYGPIPEGDQITFVDGDHDNLSLSNLCKVSLAEMARRNNLWNNYPTEVARAIQMLGALQRQINKKTKKNDHGKPTEK